MQQFLTKESCIQNCKLNSRYERKRYNGLKGYNLNYRNIFLSSEATL